MATIKKSRSVTKGGTQKSDETKRSKPSTGKGSRPVTMPADQAPEPTRDSSTGRFATAPSRSKAEEEQYQTRRDGSRLLRFRDVVRIVTDSVIVERLRSFLLYDSNPRVQLAVKPSPMAQALGKASIQARIKADDFGAPLAPLPSSSKAVRTKKHDSDRLRR